MLYVAHVTLCLGCYNSFKKCADEQEGTAGKGSYVALTVSQKLEIIRRPESGEN
jgi:hypothetical protein